MAESWRGLIKKVTVHDLVARKHFPLVIIQRTATLKEVLHLLEAANILSAPVFDSKGNPMGFVDVLDIAGYILHAWKDSSLYMDVTATTERHYKHHPILDVKVEHMLDYSRVDPLVTVKPTQTLKEVIDLFCSPKHLNRLHRVAVVNEEGKMTSVISQSDIVRFAAENTHLMPREKVSLSIKELAIARPVVSIRVDTTFYDTLELLYNSKIGGLALTDQLGRIVGNFSASDLRGLKEHAFDYFSGSTLHFLVKGTRGGLYAPISCAEKSTFEVALKTLAAQKVHRVYITDTGEHPVGILTLGDAIQLLRWKVDEETPTNLKTHV